MRKMRHALAPGAALFAVAIATPPAPAAVTLTARSSEVTASAEAFGITFLGESDGPSRSSTDSTTGFGDFVGRSASAHSASPFSTEADAYSFQNSTFTFAGPDLAGAHGHAEMTADGLTSGGGSALASSLSDFHFEFTVTGAPAPYTLTASLTSTQGAGATLRLYDTAAPAGTFLQSFDNNATVDAGGLLSPGTYRLELGGYINVATDAADHQTGGYDLTFALPKPGDASGDGRVDPDDFSLIDRGLTRHLTGWTNGDFNFDGVVNQADYLIIDQAFAQTRPLAAVIPEPAATAVLASLLIPLTHRRRETGRG